MLLATVLLSAALVPQTPAEEIETPFDTPETVQESAAEAAPDTAAEAAPAMEATPVPEPEPAPPEPPASPAPPAASPGSAQDHIDAGLKAFRRGRFSTARDAFQQAYDAAPDSAAAAFYLGYAHYKLGEPSRRMDPDKEKARLLFAKAYGLDPLFQPVWGSKRTE